MMNRNFYRMPNPPRVPPANGLLPPWIPNTSSFHHGYTYPRPHQNASPYLQQFRECVVCATPKSIGAFIHRYTNECRHSQREICDDCVYQVVSTALQGSLSNRITCPESECAAKLSSDKVREILQVSQDLPLLQRYEHHLERERVRAIPNNVECAHECGWWQTHLSSDPRVVCAYCGRTTCFNHRVRWHQGRTCAEFERHIATVDPASGQYMNRHTKTCPGCSSSIEKDSGCPHMTCTRCEAEFCWICLAPYIDDGESTVCSHRRNCTNDTESREDVDAETNHLCSSMCSIL